MMSRRDDLGRSRRRVEHLRDDATGAGWRTPRARAAARAGCSTHACLGVRPLRAPTAPSSTASLPRRRRWFAAATAIPMRRSRLADEGVDELEFVAVAGCDGSSTRTAAAVTSGRFRLPRVRRCAPSCHAPLVRCDRPGLAEQVAELVHAVHEAVAREGLDGERAPRDPRAGADRSRRGPPRSRHPGWRPASRAWPRRPRPATARS